LFLHIVLD